MPNTSISGHIFPELQTYWGKRTSDEQKHGLLYVSRIWDSSQEDIVISSDEFFEKTGFSNFATEDTENLTFLLSKILLFLEALNLIEQLPPDAQFLEAASAQIINVSSLRKVNGLIMPERDLAGFLIWHLINTSGKTELIDYLLSPTVLEPHFWQVYSILCETLPILNLEADKFVVILTNLAFRARQDNASSLIYTAGEFLGKFQPGLALEVVHKLAILRNIYGQVDLLQIMMTSIAINAVDLMGQVISLCERWLNSKLSYQLQAALLCLNNLTLRKKFEVSEYFAKVEIIAQQPSEELLYFLSLILTLLGAGFAEYSSKCVELLKKLKNEYPGEQINLGIVKGLNTIVQTVSLDYFFSCLALVKDNSTPTETLLNELDWVLFPFARSHPAKFWEYLGSWVQIKQVEQLGTFNNFDFHKSIHNAYDQDARLAISVISSWVVSESWHLVYFAFRLTQEFGIQEFSPELIKTLSKKQVVFITQKLLIGWIESNQLIKLYYNLLVQTSQFESLKNYFKETLKYLCQNYFGAFKRLNEELAQKEKTPAANLVGEVFIELDQDFKGRDGLLTKEVMPSWQRVERFFNFEKSKNKKLHKALEENDHGTLSSIIPVVKVGRGDRTMYMNFDKERTFSAPQKPGNYFGSIELQRREFIDPEEELLTRYKRILLTLNELEEE